MATACSQGSLQRLGTARATPRNPAFQTFDALSEERASQISRVSQGSEKKDGAVEVKPAGVAATPPKRRRRVMSVLLAPVRSAREYVHRRRDERKEAQVRLAQQAYERNHQGMQV